MKYSFFYFLAGLFYGVYVSSHPVQAQSPGLRFNQAWVAISQSDCLAKARQALANGQYQVTGQGNWWVASNNQRTGLAVCISCLTVGAQTQVFASAAGTSDPLAGQWVDYLIRNITGAQPTSYSQVPPVSAQAQTTLRFNQAWVNISQSDCLAKARQGLANGQYQVTGQGDWWVASTNQAARTSVCASCITIGSQTQAYVMAAGASDPLAVQWVEYLLKYITGVQSTTTTTTGTAITWNTEADNFTAGDIGKRIAYTCPAGGTANSVWGTDIYTHDSSICTAAVHSGLITVQNGGTVTIEIAGGQSSYSGTTRYGITTKGFGNWGVSFRFVR